GGDGVDADALLAVLDGGVAGQADHTVLGGGVARLVADAADAADRRGVDDGAAALLGHLRQHALLAVEDALEVDGEHASELVAAVALGQVLLALDAGVVEEAVDAAIRGDGAVDVG